MSNLTLYDVPSQQSFTPDANGRELLQKELDATFRSTRVTQPGSVRDLRLETRTRRTQAGFRYISSALFRVCRVAAPGLSNVVTNLAAGGRGPEHTAEACSLPTACAVFNQVVDLRFGGVLSTCQLVVDEERKTVEGFLGPKTHYLENVAFVELAEDVLQDTAAATFAGATLVGRRLFIRYLRPERIMTPVGIYRSGYAFCLTESGDDAIKAYTLYQREECGSACLEVTSVRTQRQKRTGSRFLEKLKQLLTTLLRQEPRAFDDEVQNLMGTRVFTNTDHRIVKREIAAWHRKMRLAGTPHDVAHRAMDRLLERDRVTGDPMTESRLAAKTAYDLFLILTEEGRIRGQRVRELVERAAFKVFFGDDV